MSEEVYDRIRILRRKLGLNQTQFAERIELSQNHMSFIETGKRRVSSRMIRDIRDVFGVNEDWLLYGHQPIFTADKESVEVNNDTVEGENTQRQNVEVMTILQQEFSLTPVDVILIKKLLQLTPQARAAVITFIQEVSDSITNYTIDEQVRRYETAEKLRMEADVAAYRQQLETDYQQSHTIAKPSSTTSNTIDVEAEVKAFKQELEAEASSGGRLSQSDDTAGERKEAI